MGTERQKTVEGQHLSRVKAQRNRAIALISVFCQWSETTEKGSTRRNAWSAPTFCATPLYGLKAGALESLSRRRCLCGNADLERLSEFPKTLYEFV
jgi:hypothetical protein